MDDRYRLRIKMDNLEFEVESSSQEFVETKYKEALTRMFAKSPPPIQQRATGKPARIQKQDKNVSEKDLDIAGYVAHIKEKSEFPTIDTNVLNDKDQLPRIMLCLYYCNEYFGSPFLTSGQISLITDQFGVRIQVKNVGPTIKANQGLFTLGKIRKQGVTIPYKLNRRGLIEFKTKYLSKA
jgi:hypothetical protein